METRIERVAEKAKADKNACFTSLAHHLTKCMLRKSLQGISRSSAKGVDGKTREDAEEIFEEWSSRVIDEIHKRGYSPPPVKRVYIPKLGKSEKRPIGVPTILDRCLQASTAKVLEAVYEQDFLENSFGGRPGRNAHQALATITRAITFRKVSWIYEADLKNFFGSLSHQAALEFFMHRVKDPRIILLIRRWMKAGIMEAGNLTQAETGTPQGGPISVLISNVYLHYVLDLWIEKVVKPRMRGEVYYVRYIDDFVLGFQYKEDADQFAMVLPKRLNKFALELEPTKTRLLRFGRFAAKGTTVGRPDTFSFLGFTFYCTTTSEGRFKVGLKTEKSRVKRGLISLKEITLMLRHCPLKDQVERINLTLAGHYRYYGIGGNFPSIQRIYRITVRLWLKALRSRTQRHNLTWEKYNKILVSFPLLKPRIYVPFTRFNNLAKL